MSRRILARSQAQLARVLGVWPSAVGKAWRARKIVPEADGTSWDVLAVARRWRAATNAFLLRPWAKERPWLDPRVPWTAEVEAALVARCVEAGLVAATAAEQDDSDAVAVQALVAELTAEAACGPRWDLAVDAWQQVEVPPCNFTAAEARAALEAVPHAREWIFHAWLTGGEWWPAPRVHSLRGARREMVAAALDFLVTLHRLAAPGERQRRIRADKAAARRIDAEWPGMRARVRAIVDAAESGGADGDDLAMALGFGGRGTAPTCPRS